MNARLLIILNHTLNVYTKIFLFYLKINTFFSLKSFELLSLSVPSCDRALTLDLSRATAHYDLMAWKVKQLKLIYFSARDRHTSCVLLARAFMIASFRVVVAAAAVREEIPREICISI